MRTKDNRKPLRPAIAVRLDEEGGAILDAWCDALNASNPGLTFSEADAVRSLIALAATLPQVAQARRKAG
jgi:hypothetical protein